MSKNTIEDIIEASKPYSPFLSRNLDVLRADPQFSLSLDKALTVDFFEAYAPWSLWMDGSDEVSLAQALRHLRRFVVTHIMVRDLARESDLAEVTQTISLFADFAINKALIFAYAYYQKLYGTPIGHYSHQAQHLSVVAMGKMGGYELNVSSDIDLIFVYPESGETDGKKSRDNQVFFTKVAQKLITILDDVTVDGRVFRVDMRLRPDGDSGALVVSETALEQYLIQQGREWERYAWTKARLVTPYDNGLRLLVRPFVYRKYLDYNAIEAMRLLHAQIRQEVLKKYKDDNIKLGRGGIREIEFVAQIFQMIKGGQIRSLQLKGTRETLKQLAHLGILDTETVDDLLQAYCFLRDVEHRLQYWEDQQTQILPQHAEQQILLAQSMGFDDYPLFLQALNQYRSRVHEIFQGVLGGEEDESQDDTHDLAQVWHADIEDEARSALLRAAGFVKTQHILQRMDTIYSSGKYRQLSERTRTRFDALIPQILDVAALCPRPDETLVRLLDFISGIMRRSSYLALLHEHPEALKRLGLLMSRSFWISNYLMRHPILLDELLNAELLNTDLDWGVFRQELVQAMDACSDDVEAKMDTLRHYQHAQTFRFSIQELEGLWTIEGISDQLSALADVILSVTVDQVWRTLKKKHTEHPNFAVIAYGKLGGKELAYSSDLDLVYLFDDEHPDAIETYARLAHRVSSWLSSTTGAGILYDVDLRLRPNGEAGFAATSLKAFERYQYQEAWIWEHQALSRARFICGDETIHQAFDTIRADILMQERDVSVLREAIVSMREKMFPTHPPVDEDIKYARGGIVDVEFIVQYLVLAHSGTYPELTANTGNIALLKLAATKSLISDDLAEKASVAYREYRRINHNKRLLGSQYVLDVDALQVYYAPVRVLWFYVLKQNIGS